MSLRPAGTRRVAETLVAGARSLGQLFMWSGGNASTPSIAVDGDGNTGIYPSSADILAIGGGGAASSLHSAGAISVNGSIFAANLFASTQAFNVPTAATALLAGLNVELNNTFGAPLTMTSTPTIANGLDGQMILLTCISANSITVQDQGTLANSNLRLGNASRTLGPRDMLLLRYSSSIGDWIEIAFSNVT